MYSEGEVRKFEPFDAPSPSARELASPAPGPASPNSVSRIRRFLGADGREWRVREVASTYDRRRTKSLIFDTFDAARRVRQYPANWYELTDADLAKLGQVTGLVD
jgi:hypothetical protein